MLVGVLEDDASIRRVLGEALRLSGHETLVAHTGAEALRAFGTDSGVDEPLSRRPGGRVTRPPRRHSTRRSSARPLPSGWPKCSTSTT